MIKIEIEGMDFDEFEKEVLDIKKTISLKEKDLRLIRKNKAESALKYISICIEKSIACAEEISNLLKNINKDNIDSTEEKILQQAYEGRDYLRNANHVSDISGVECNIPFQSTDYAYCDSHHIPISIRLDRTDSEDWKVSDETKSLIYDFVRLAETLEEENTIWNTSYC